MRIKVNTDFGNIKETYLFSEIASRVRKYSEEHPDKKIIRMGIGDVTLPLPKVVTDAMKSAADEMGNKETFRGYPPEYGYDCVSKREHRHCQHAAARPDAPLRPPGPGAGLRHGAGRGRQGRLAGRDNDLRRLLQ